MKEYISALGDKLTIDGENITFTHRKDGVKRFTFSNIIELTWNEPVVNEMKGMFMIKTNSTRDSVNSMHFTLETRETFLELRDFISQKTGIEPICIYNSLKRSNSSLVRIAIFIIIGLAIAYSGLQILLN